jgi:hypothetical protein
MHQIRQKITTGVLGIDATISKLAPPKQNPDSIWSKKTSRMTLEIRREAFARANEGEKKSE